MVPPPTDDPERRSEAGRRDGADRPAGSTSVDVDTTAELGAVADDLGPCVPLRSGGPCPHCGEEIENLDFLNLPSVAIKKWMYDVCVVETDALPTPWRHPTAIAYHEDPSPCDGSITARPDD